MMKTKTALVAICVLLCNTVFAENVSGQELFGPIYFGASGPISTEAAYYRRTDDKGNVKALVLFTKEFRSAYESKEPWFTAMDGEPTAAKDMDLSLEFGSAKIKLTELSAFVVVQADGTLVFFKPFEVSDLKLFEFLKSNTMDRSLEGLRKLEKMLREK